MGGEALESSGLKEGTYMRLARGNMFDHPCDMILATTNAFIRTNGSLFMGRGAAKEMVKRFQGADFELGAVVDQWKQEHAGSSRYGIALDPHWRTAPWSAYALKSIAEAAKKMPLRAPLKGICDHVLIGAFQVKNHWGNPAETELIANSVERLVEILATPAYERWSVSLNFPGIGNGRLERRVVLPLLEPLPENVTVWEK